MVKRGLFAAALVSFVGLAAMPALAATLADATGKVLVNQGAGFVAGSLSQALPVGSRVMVQGSGQAKVSYPDLCVVIVTQEHVHTVGDKSPCATGAQSKVGDLLPHDYTIGVGIAAAVGIGVGIAILSDDGKSKSTSP